MPLLKRTVVCLVTRGDETAYGNEVLRVIDWFAFNNVNVNINKSRE